MTSWVFFDMDGTLIDSVPALYRSYSLFLRSHGISGSKEEFDELNGPSLVECVQILMERHKLRGSFESNIKTYYSIVEKEAQKVDERPGAGMILSHLKSSGQKISLVTSATTPIARKILKKTRWARLFDQVTCGEEVKSGKPSPDIYRLALQKAGCAAKDVLVVEDSVNGLLSARRAGLKAMHVDEYFETYPAVSCIWKGDVIEADLVGPAPKELDDKIFSVGNFKSSLKKAKFSGAFVPYQKFKDSVGDPNLKKRINVLAVSGLARVAQGKEFVYLIGLRSRSVSTYQDHWEFAPSGGVDGESLGRSKSIDLKRVLMKELEEESGFGEEDVASVKTLGILHDRKIGAYDCAYLIDLKPLVLESKKLRSDRREYSRMMFLSRQQIEELITTEKKIVPTLRLFWDMYVSSRNKRGSL